MPNQSVSVTTILRLMMTAELAHDAPCPSAYAHDMGYGRHDEKVRVLLARVTGRQGHLPVPTREALLRGEAPSGALGVLAAQVMRDATRVSDATFAAAASEGATEDELFDAVTVSAVGAALKRLNKGLSLLDGVAPAARPPAPKKGVE
jgi:hypothetical protein